MKSKEVGNRVRDFIVKQKKTQGQMADILGIPQSNISEMLTGKRDIDKLVEAIETHYGFEEGTFTRGIGEDGFIDTSGKPHFISIAHAGLLTAEQGSDYELQPIISQLPRYDYTVEVRGDSMTPEYKSGDIVACLNVTHSTFFQWGRVHLLNTSQGVLLKKIFDEGDCLKCVSVNSLSYPDIVIPKEEIYSIGLVVGALRIS